MKIRNIAHEQAARRHLGHLALGILAFVSLVSCSRKQVNSEEIGRGYTAEILEVRPTVVEYRLYRAANDGRRLVTMAIVEGGRLQTLLPTVYQWGCSGARDSNYLETVSCGAIGDKTRVTVVTLKESGQVALGSSPAIFDIATFGKDVCRLIDGVLVAEVEMQVDLASFQSFIEAAANAEKLSALVVRPRLEHPTRQLRADPAGPIDDTLESAD